MYGAELYVLLIAILAASHIMEYLDNNSVPEREERRILAISNGVPLPPMITVACGTGSNMLSAGEIALRLGSRR